MADGEVTVKLDPETTRRLVVVAQAAGQTVPDYVRGLITDRLQGDDDWDGDVAAFETFRRDGVSLSVEEAMEHYDAAAQAQLSKYD